MSYGVILTKILKTEHVNDFLDGNLYLNTLSYFASLDNSDQARSDPHDGLFESHQVSSVKIQDTDGAWVPIGGIINPVIFRNDHLSNFNVLCLYSMTDRDGDFFDQRNILFGEAAIIIENLPEFLSRIKLAATNQGWEMNQSPVEYVARKSYDGYMGPFRKFDNFSYQNEFRFIFKTNLKEPCRLNIGNLRDITNVTFSNEISSIWSWLKSRNYKP